MKKSLLFLITIMVLGACTSNSTLTDDVDEVTDPVDVSNKKPISVQFEGGNVAFDLVTINYDGQGRIQSLEDPTINYRQDYVYEGEFLKRIENYTNNVLGSQTVYEYENGLVIRSLNYNADNEVTLRRTFVYENNVLASYTNEYLTSSLGDTTWDFTYDASQNKVTRTNRDDPQVYQVTTYDENKSPYYNLPTRRLLDKTNGNNASNNILQIVSYSNGAVNDVKDYTNTYDNDGFLLTTTYDVGSGTMRTETFTYNE